MHEPMLNIASAFATALSDRVAAAVVGTSGLGQTAAEGLLTVCNHPGEPVEALASRLALTPAGATRLLDRLERKHLIRRKRAAGDGRSRVVQPTVDGRRLAFQMLKVRGEVTARMLAALSPVEQAELERLLASLLAASNGDPAPAKHPCRMCDQGACGADCPRAP